jgi:hypothetical protein
VAGSRVALVACLTVVWKADKGFFNLQFYFRTSEFRNYGITECQNELAKGVRCY